MFCFAYIGNHVAEKVICVQIYAERRECGLDEGMTLFLDLEFHSA